MSSRRGKAVGSSIVIAAIILDWLQAELGRLWKYEEASLGIVGRVLLVPVYSDAIARFQTALLTGHQGR